MRAQYIRIDEDGNKFTYKDKEMKVLHCETGPAMDYKNGSKYWLENGVLHRNYGPASVCENGNTFWYLNGQRHRTDGPAMEFEGNKLWYLNDKQVTQEEHARLTKKVTTVTINGKEFTVNTLIETLNVKK